MVVCLGRSPMFESTLNMGKYFVNAKKPVLKKIQILNFWFLKIEKRVSKLFLADSLIKLPQL
jgi:hypothetical protein